MKEVKDITCLVIDTGTFQHVARRLSRDYAKTYFWSPWENNEPRFKDAIICDGYEGVIRAESVEDVEDECDLFVFTDIGYSGLQRRLLNSGKAVWGCQGADGLEARRGYFLDKLSTTALPMPPHSIIKGLTNLRLYLADHEDQFIKVSTYRGDFETCRFRNMSADEAILDKWAHMLGPLKEEFIFYCFDEIETEIEDGIDTWCIDGQWPETIIHGMECKDSSYIGAFQKFTDVPTELRIANEEFGPVLAEYGYRGAFSTEVRITKEKESYFIDPTCRFPSPPSQVMCEMIGNLGEVIWDGANGIMCEPEQVAAFGAQAIFMVDRKEWGVFEIPEEIDQFVKIGFSCKVDGKICVPPDPLGVKEIGWCVGIGDTMQEAIEHLREVKDAMPSGCNVQFDSLAELLKEMETAKELGMKMSDGDIPAPASII